MDNLDSWIIQSLEITPSHVFSCPLIQNSLSSEEFYLVFPFRIKREVPVFVWSRGGGGVWQQTSVVPNLGPVVWPFCVSDYLSWDLLSVLVILPYLRWGHFLCHWPLQTKCQHGNCVQNLKLLVHLQSLCLSLFMSTQERKIFQGENSKQNPGPIHHVMRKLTSDKLCCTPTDLLYRDSAVWGNCHSNLSCHIFFGKVIVQIRLESIGKYWFSVSINGTVNFQDRRACQNFLQWVGGSTGEDEWRNVRHIHYD